MLQSIRDKSQGWIAWTIVGAICITFALWGVKSYLYGNAANDAVVKVNKTTITKRQLNNAYNQLKRQKQIRLGANFSLSDADSKKIRASALQSLISSIVLTQNTQKSGFHIAPQLVDATIAKMPVFQINGEFSKSRFNRVISAMLYSQDQFFDEVQNDLLVAQLKLGIIQSSFALPNEVRQTYRLMNQKRNFGYTIIPINRFLQNISLPPDATKQYYKEHQEEYKTPEKLSIDYLELSVPHLMKNIHPTDQQLKAYYRNHITAYSQPKKWKLANILIKVDNMTDQKSLKTGKDKIDHIASLLKSGKNFNVLVKKYSEDSSTVDQQGHMQSLAASQMSSDVHKAVMSLNKVGDLSTVVQTRRGFEIFKLLSVDPKKVMTFESVKHKVTLAFKQQQAEQQFSDHNDQLANITYENPDSLKQASKQLALPIHSTGLFTKEGGDQPITKNPKILVAAFSDEVLNQKNNSDPINISDDTVVVIRIKKHQPASVKSFEQVKSNITRQLRKKLAEQELKKFGESLLDEINAKPLSAKSIAVKHHLDWHNAINVSRQSKNVNSSILEKAFQLSRPSKKITHINAAINLPTGDYAIISLLKIQDASIKQLSTAEYRPFMAGIKNAFGVLDYQLYMKGLMDRAKIKHFKE